MPPATSPIIARIPIASPAFAPPDMPFLTGEELLEVVAAAAAAVWETFPPVGAAIEEMEDVTAAEAAVKIDKGTLLAEEVMLDGAAKAADEEDEDDDALGIT